MNKHIEFLKPKNLDENFQQIEKNIRLGVPTAVFGVFASLKGIITASVSGQVLYIAQNFIAAKEIYDIVKDITDKKTALLTAKDDVYLYKEAFAKDSLYKRLSALGEIESGAEIIIADIEAVMQLLPKEFKSIKLIKGNEYALSDLISKLINIGYKRDYGIETRGVFTVRGDIIDIFPLGSDMPVRLDFFGDELESIRYFDISIGKRLEELRSVEIIPATDIFICKDEHNHIIETLNIGLNEFKNTDGYKKAGEIIGELTQLLKSGDVSDKLSFIMPLLKNSTDIFSILQQDATIIFDESKLLLDATNNLEKEKSERLENLKSGGQAFSFTTRQTLASGELIDRVQGFKKVVLQNFATKNPFFTPVQTVSVKSTASRKYLYNLNELFKDISAWQKSGYKVAVFCEGITKAERMHQILYENGWAAKIAKDFNLHGGVTLFPHTMSKGIILHDSKIAVIGSGDLYVKKLSEKRLKRSRKDLFTSPEIGDYAVHEQHGIGRITGTKRIEILDGAKDYIALEYKGGDILYVPVEQMNILSKYMGEGKPPISKLGGIEFERAKQRAIKAIKKLSFDLRNLYNKRQQAAGFRHAADGELMTEFESTFEYEPTDDQLISYAEIKADMESDKVMDRLLCGDVGYGKTEVALRAVLKAVVSGKQAALLCPTTILSQQHYSTALKRFESIGIKIQVLNRFKSRAAQNRILDDLKHGKIDFIIGTHRLLSKDIAFKDLGLLILDEEQRFGVEHKERIKTLKNNVDCLTMTATPIPRTLYMSLSGIRDISTIDTPPKERLPVETYVVEESEALIRDGSLKELSRGGQVFILYNRVESIYQFSEKVRQILPEATISVAHGRLSESELENSILDFYNNQSNVLITTTIIENGIDLPNANTIIIIDSDRFGISQLYQLRGRVGRSSRVARAYLTFKADKVLSEDAVKRLSAIMEFTELGSGFKIAMRDLELRGAGNILGGEQHGHIAKIGYELYSKLLKEEMSGVAEEEIDLDIKVSAYIPELYIEKSSARLETYKRLAEIKDIKEYEEMSFAIEELYGAMPTGVKNLLDIALLKSLAKKLGFIRIKIDKNAGELIFPSIEKLQNKELLSALENRKDIAVQVIDRPTLAFENRQSAQNILSEMLEFLQKI